MIHCEQQAKLAPTKNEIGHKIHEKLNNKNSDLKARQDKISKFESKLCLIKEYEIQEVKS
jgi:hypothetical protein